MFFSLSYIEETFFDNPDQVWKKINECTAQIASLMYESYETPIKIYLTFESKIEPYVLNFENQVEGIAFVDQKFSW